MFVTMKSWNGKSMDLTLPKSKTISEKRIFGPTGLAAGAGSCPKTKQGTASRAIARAAPRIHGFITGPMLPQVRRTAQVQLRPGFAESADQYLYLWRQRTTSLSAATSPVRMRQLPHGNGGVVSSMDS